MTETKKLVNTIVEGIQEKKGYKIVIADLTHIDNTICKYFIICQGNSPSQVSAVTDEIYDHVCEDSGEKPISIDGKNNSEWVAIDYSDIVVHVFLPEIRKYYDLEHLWEDAQLTEIADFN